MEKTIEQLKNMNEYKLSTTSIEIITQFLKTNFDFDWDGSNTPQMLNQTDCFVFSGKIPNETNPENGEVISWRDGLHFDILTNNCELNIPIEITIHYPTNPKHTFA